MNFLGLSDEEANFESAKYAVLPVGYERTTTYGHGTANGPKAIIAASQEVELYDEELKSEPYLAGVCTVEGFNDCEASSESMIAQVTDKVADLLDSDKFVITLGGEHSISVAPVTAYAKRFSNLSILQVDAHADLRQSYLDDKHSHACAMRRIREVVSSTVGVGIRNMSREEADVIESERIPTFLAKDIAGKAGWEQDVVDNLSENVYVTIDLDGFDPSVMPGVGTPEPGGLLWHEALSLFRVVCGSRNVVGFDVVELMPIPGSLVSEFTAAKLIYKIIGCIQSFRS